ncbi:MAG: sulfurtransferase [Proteobacteria bacterium]|nr:MAG: sulfurtransferase [Pseudomonadota bacterium]
MESRLSNLSFYRFLPLENLPILREKVRELGAQLNLMGTVLLAQEGVNAMVSGEPAAIETFLCEMRALFGELPAKVAPVPEHSFHRFLVKIKKEIIAVGDPALKPHERTAKRVSAAELKAWLDEGRDVTLVDTRNTYEIEVGTFRGAENLGLEISRDFAQKALPELDRWKDRTVVTFCTGGIRCEKASAHLLNQGLENVYQLDGGILRYLEENGAAHFEGNCFVYDWRMAVDGELKPVPRAADAKKSFGRHKLEE